MIYFIEAIGVGNIKIGFTDHDDAVVRMAQLQTGSPVPLRLLGTIPGSLEDEKDLHRSFASARVTGEWFRPVPELVALVNAPELPRCGTTEVVIKSVQIKVLTVGRKQFTKSMLVQLSPGKLIDMGYVATRVSDGIESPQPEDFEEGEFWGWVRLDDGHHKCLIFRCAGELRKQIIHPGYSTPSVDGLLMTGKINKILQSFWHQCCANWFSANNQLFIGT